MAISRWDPFNDLASLRDQMDRLLGRGRDESWMPAIDVYDGKYALIVKAEVPGIDPDDIEVSVDQNMLVLRGERRFEERSEEEGTYRVERRYGRFERSLTLPQNSDIDDISANCENGVLEVRVSKTAAAEPRRVTVGHGGQSGLQSGQHGKSSLPMQQTDVDLSTSSRSEPPIVPQREVEEGLEPPTPTGEGGGEQAA